MDKTDLDHIEGIKIRRQYFNVVLCYAGVFFIGAILTMMVAELKWGTFDWERILPELVEVLPLMLGVFVPCAVLSVLNRLFFGEVICVLNDQGLHYKEGTISWSSIHTMTFHATNVQRRIRASGMGGIRGITYAYTNVECTQGLFAIQSAPLYMLWKVKKYNPDIKVKLDKLPFLLIAMVIVIAIVVPVIK